MDKLAELLRQGADKLVNLPTEAQRFVTNPQAFIQLLTGKNALPRETGFAAGATGLPAQQGTVLDPNYQAYMQGYEQGEPVSYAAMATPAAVPVAKALAPKAGQMAEQYMVNQGFMPSLIAYHGTPHTIKGKFDISKVGTGEGAQAYGHGMYFAEAPDVAKTYMTVGGKGEFVRIGDKVVPTASQEGQLLSDVTKLGRKAAINKYPDQADYIKTINPDNIQFEGGNLYKVDIPDEYIPNMLDWDKPLSQQPASVQNWLKDPYNAYKEKLTAKDVGGNEPTGNLIYNRLQELMSEGKKSDVFANQANLGALNASRELADYGITGVRYLDANSRPNNVVDKKLENLYQKHSGDIEKAADDFMRTVHNTPKEKAKIRETIVKSLQNRPTSNFVVFEPSNVKILEQNSKPMTRKEIIEQELKKVVE